MCKTILTKSATCYYSGPSIVKEGTVILGCIFSKETKNNILGSFEITSSDYEFNDNDNESKREASQKASKEVEDKKTAVITILNLSVEEGSYKIESCNMEQNIFDLKKENKIIGNSFNTRCSTVNFLDKIDLDKESQNALFELYGLYDDKSETLKLMIDFYNSGKSLRYIHPKSSFILYYNLIETFWVSYMGENKKDLTEIGNILKLDRFFNSKSIDKSIIYLSNLNKKKKNNVIDHILFAIEEARGKFHIAHGKIKDSIDNRKIRLPFRELEIIAREAVLYCLSQETLSINRINDN